MSAAPELPEAAIERAPIMWKVKADSLREAADWLEDMVSGYTRESGQLRAGRDIISRLRDRADRIERGGDA